MCERDKERECVFIREKKMCVCACVCGEIFLDLFLHLPQQTKKVKQKFGFWKE